MNRGILDILYSCLCDVFGEGNIIRDYPFPNSGKIKASFYLPERDLYIDLLPSGSHTGHWYGTDPVRDEAIVRAYQNEIASGSMFHAVLLQIWTVSDVRRRQAAQDGRLNYVVFRDMDLWDFVLWGAVGCPGGRDWEKDYSWLPDRDIGSPVFPTVRKMGAAGISRVVKQYQFSEFYKRELTLWRENGLYKDVPLQAYLYMNRLQYLDKGPLELTDLELARAFKIAGICKGYSVYDTRLMDQVVTKYGIGSVYDPCAGWGERMLYCQVHDVTYHGVDINRGLEPGYQAMMEAYAMTKQTIEFGDSSVVVPTGSYDAVITCPPYGDTEIYTDMGAENLDEQGFLDWWRRVILNCLEVTPKCFCFQVNQKWKDRMVAVAKDCGLEFIEELTYSTNRSSHLTRSRGTKSEHESMMVFVTGW